LITSIQYEQNTNAVTKKPVYYVVFGPIAEGSSAYDHQTLPDEFSTGTIKGSTKYRRQIMNVPQGTSSSITPYSGKASIGEVNFTLQDSDGVITKMVGDRVLKNRIVTIYGGYENIIEAYFYPVYRGQLKDYSLTSEGGAYSFTLTDIVRQAKATIFNGLSALTETVKADTPTLSVYNCNFFAEKTDLGDGLGNRNYIRVDDEVIHYTSILHNPDGRLGSFLGCTRGVLGTVPADHDMDAEVSNYIRIEGNPLDIALQILSSTGLGTNGDYDILPVTQGVGIEEQYIDTDTFTALRDRWISTMQFRFYVQEAVEAKTWLEDNIYKAINAYPTTTVDGKLSVWLYSVPLPTSNIQTFDESNIIGIPQWSANLSSGKAFFNELQIQYDYDAVNDKYKSVDIYSDSTSQVKYAEVSPLLYEQRGVRTDLRSDLINLRTSGNIFKRFSDPAPQITCRTFFSQHLITTGNTVYIRHKALPDVKTGRRGESSLLCEVTERNIDWVGGSVQFTLLTTEYKAVKKYGAISPANYPVYTLATNIQRAYAFIGHRITPTIVQMSNGDDGYYVSP
jgi:hypothetical protein